MAIVFTQFHKLGFLNPFPAPLFITSSLKPCSPLLEVICDSQNIPAPFDPCLVPALKCGHILLSLPNLVSKLIQNILLSTSCVPGAGETLADKT